MAEVNWRKILKAYMDFVREEESVDFLWNSARKYPDSPLDKLTKVELDSLHDIANEGRKEYEGIDECK
jgi:hypothetical protein